jgi:chromosome segregation ATPase
MQRLQTSFDDAQTSTAALEVELSHGRAELASTTEQLEASREDSARLSVDLEVSRARVESLTRTLESKRSEFQLLIEQKDEAARQTDAHLLELDRLRAELQSEKELSAQRLDELEEEQRRRDEMVRDLAYVQTQITDLAATKGALVSRIEKMTKRETTRQRSTVEITDLLRSAEAVAADKLTSLRRMQAHAVRLEERVVELEHENASLRSAVEAGEQAQRQLAAISAERDALRVQITYFQKQIGAMQRAKQSPVPPAPRPKAPPVLPPAQLKPSAERTTAVTELELPAARDDASDPET